MEIESKLTQDYIDVFLDYYHRLKERVAKFPNDTKLKEEFSKASEVLSWICFGI